METKGIVIAGLAGGSGKSVVSVGLTAHLVKKGDNVVPFKKGPDYIDAGWMALAAESACYNLDPYLMSEEAIHFSFLKNSHEADIVIVEGNRGLYDGVNASGGYSTAELAISLKLPVLLVVNCTKTTRTIAALVLGCKMLDERIDIRGVVLNQIATKRQKDIITKAVEDITKIPVLGVIPRMKRDIFPMRHLGMVPHQEYQGSDAAISLLAETVEQSLDIEGIKDVMSKISLPRENIDIQPKVSVSNTKVRIGIIQDTAFQFYYSENLEALRNEGAELVAVNALEDEGLPDLDGLYIGGGFPETSAKELAANSSFRESIKQAAEKGLPIYAECGGLIYLGESILIDEKEYPLVGIFPVRFGMSVKPQAHGYTIFKVDKKNPFYDIGTTVKGHEFRYSIVLEWGGNEQDLVLMMKRGKGFADQRDGLCYKNVLALYTHVHSSGTPEWARGIARICRRNE